MHDGHDRDDGKNERRARELDDRRVLARLGAECVARGNDRRRVVDRGTGPDAELALREMQRVAERGKRQHRHDVVEENRRDRERHIGFERLDHRCHRRDRRRTANRRADADEMFEHRLGFQEPTGDRREDERDGDRADRDRQRFPARLRDRSER